MTRYISRSRSALSPSAGSNAGRASLRAIILAILPPSVSSSPPLTPQVCSSDSDMDRHPIHGESRLPEGLAQCRVGMHADADLPSGALQELGQHRLGDEVGHIVAHQ